MEKMLSLHLGIRMFNTMNHTVEDLFLLESLRQGV